MTFLEICCQLLVLLLCQVIVISFFPKVDFKRNSGGNALREAERRKDF